MRELTGNLFRPATYNPQIGKPDAVGISTNGFVKNNGAAVLGKGCAKEAVNIDPEIPFILGNLLLEKGNFPHILRDRPGRATLVSIPVKPINKLIETKEDLKYLVPHMRKPDMIGKPAPGWACISDIEIIRLSCTLIVEIANERNWEKVVIPRLGCGAGCLSWEEVKEEVNQILDDRFYAITFPPKGR